MILKEYDGSSFILRPIKKSDYIDFYEYGSDIRVCKYVNWGPIKNKKDALWMIKKTYIKSKQNGYAIINKENNKLIGIIDFHNVSKSNHSAEIGYSLNYNYQNRGIMTEALKLMIKIGFMDCNYHRIEIKIASNNDASKRVALKADFKYEATLKEAYFDKRENRYYDVSIYSILKEYYIRGELKWQ